MEDTDKTWILFPWKGLIY